MTIKNKNSKDKQSRSKIVMKPKKYNIMHDINNIVKGAYECSSLETSSNSGKWEVAQLPTNCFP